MVNLSGSNAVPTQDRQRYDTRTNYAKCKLSAQNPSNRPSLVHVCVHVLLDVIEGTTDPSMDQWIKNGMYLILFVTFDLTSRKNFLVK